MVYSQIWLNLCKNYHHNSYISQWMIATWQQTRIPSKKILAMKNYFKATLVLNVKHVK